MAPQARSGRGGSSSVPMLAVLHPAFALTGVLHAVGGPLLPSLASTFHLTDSQSGLLFLAYFAGTALGALLCGRNHTRSLVLGFGAAAAMCVIVAISPQILLDPAFFCLGIAVGMPMSAVSMIAGRRFADRSAAPLTLLNFSWSVGALLAPLLAARLLLSHTYRSAYVVLSCASAVAALACWLSIQEAPPASKPQAHPRLRNVRLIALFAVVTFLEVGVENIAASWLATFALRSSGTGAAHAAVLSSFYWIGFLASRGVASFLLVHAKPARVLALAVSSACLAAILLISLPGVAAAQGAMALLGASLAPIFPLLLAAFFARAQDSSDSRWVLAFCGFGGSVLPWLTGFVSSHSGSLRLGLITVPGALLLIGCLLPFVHDHPQPHSAQAA
jgi:FHS family glucose/mannose:H+ symporter-like MFS transporter